MLKILQLIATLRGIFGDLPIGMILQIIQRLASIGLPPPIEQEENLRHWCTSLVPILDDMAGLTSTEIDDQVAMLLRVAVEDNDAWAALYGLLTLAGDGRVRADGGVQVLSDKVGFDLATILMIVQAIIKIIEMLR